MSGFYFVVGGLFVQHWQDGRMVRTDDRRDALRLRFDEEFVARGVLREISRAFPAPVRMERHVGPGPANKRKKGGRDA